MRVFITGASGNIGSAVAADLVAAGHEFIGLARSQTSADAIAAAGGTPLRGDLADLAVLREGAESADGVINLAFSADFSNLGPGIEEEANTVKTIGDALAGTGKPFVHAGGTPFVPGRASTEVDPSATQGPMGGRGINSDAVLALAEQGVRSCVVRLPRSVHLRGSAYGFASALIANAQRTGVSGYIGNGTQRWPAVHRLDAARLFRLALEEAAPGINLHAVADEGDTMLSLAAAIGEVLAVPVERVEEEEAFGKCAHARAVQLGAHPPEPARRPQSWRLSRPRRLGGKPATLIWRL